MCGGGGGGRGGGDGISTRGITQTNSKPQKLDRVP